MRIVCICLALAFFLPPAVASGGENPPGFGVLGDSFSDEYQFYVPDRGAARNWVEILQHVRGLNFGPPTSSQRPEPRNAGFGFNWARSGATSQTMTLQGQAEGLAEQAKSGEVRYAILFIGGNDFIEAILSDEAPRAWQGLANQVFANIQHAIATLKSAAPRLRILILTVPDVQELPDVAGTLQQRKIDREMVGFYRDELSRLNTMILRLADSDGGLGVLDLAGITKAGSMLFPRYLMVGGDRINREVSSDPLHSLFLPDGRHLGTVGQGLMARAIVQSLNFQFGTEIPPLHEEEILRFARNIPKPEELVQNIPVSPR